MERDPTERTRSVGTLQEKPRAYKAALSRNAYHRVPVADTNPPAFPFIAIPEADLLDGPSGPQRVRQAIKQLFRQHRIRVEWLPGTATEGEK